MMNPNQISSAQLLDIVFDGRNKDYGAYPLRKHYNQRMGVSISLVLLVSFAFLFTSLVSKEKVVANYSGEAKEFILEKDPTQKIEKKQVITPARKIASRRFTPFLVVRDNLFKKDSIPTISELENQQISTMSTPGDTILSDAPPPVPVHAEIEKAVVVVTEKIIYENPEKAAGFPGGADAWRRYLERNLVYPEEAIEIDIQGIVRVQFIVDENGNISEVRPLNDPGSGLAKEACRIISNGPKWMPAEQDGHPVISKHVQTIHFRLQ